MLIKGGHGLYSRTRSAVIEKVFPSWVSHSVLWDSMPLDSL